MGNLKLRLSICVTGMILLGLCLGIFGPEIAQDTVEEFQPIHLALGAFVYMGLCGVLFYGMLERALNPVINLTDQFMRMRLGDLDLRLPVEGPEEMQCLAQAFNETIEDLEIQIRDIQEEKQAAERGRQFVVEQLEAVGRFKSMIDSAPVGLVLADSDLNIVYQNGISESGFIQLETFLEWNADVVIGRPMSKLFPDEAEAHGILSDPGRLPYEKVFLVGPYEIRFLVGPVYSEEGDDLGLVLLWEVIEAEDVVEDVDQMEERVEEVEDELDNLDRMDPTEDLIFEEVDEDEVIEQPLFEEILAAESDPETSSGRSNLSDREAVVGRNVIASKDQLRRGTALVSRSVRLLSERLSTVRSMVEALCSEGDGLRSSLEETRQRTQHVTYLTSERSESLWELVGEVHGVEERIRATAMLVKRFRKNLGGGRRILESIGKLSDAIEHMVLEARLEMGRAGDAGKGMKVVMDEIRKLGRQAAKMDRDVKDKVEQWQAEVDEVIGLVEEDQREVRAGGRVARRAENALERIERDLTDLEERTNLLSEMTSGQSEIGSQIASQLEELTELIQVTGRVTMEQTRLVESLLEDAEDGRVQQSL